MRYVYRRDEMVNDVTRNRLRFIQIPSKRLKKDTRTQVNNSTFIFIADKVFGLPVALRWLANKFAVVSRARPDHVRVESSSSCFPRELMKAFSEF